MDVALSPYKHKGGRPSRLFTITLRAEETKAVIERSNGMIARDSKQGVNFQIMDGRKPVSSFDEEIDKCFRPLPLETDDYYFMSPGGFKTDEEHLEWLIELGEIPILFGNDDTVIGYVVFKNAA